MGLKGEQKCCVGRYCITPKALLLIYCVYSLKDKDVARLQDFQELELVLMMSDNDFLFRNAAPTLTERPCYNKKASKLTY